MRPALPLYLSMCNAPVSINVLEKADLAFERKLVHYVREQVYKTLFSLVSVSAEHL